METWKYSPEPGASLRAALKGGKTAVLVAPPSYYSDLWTLSLLTREYPIEGLQIVLIPNISEASRVAEHLEHLEAGPTHVVSGIDYSGRVLGRGFVKFLVTTPEDAVALLKNSSLPVADVVRVISLNSCSPRSMPAVEEILTQISGPRLFKFSSLDGLDDFLKRHAHRAPVMENDESPSNDEAMSPKCRFAVETAVALPDAVQRVLDNVNPGSTLIWSPSAIAMGGLARYQGDPGVNVTVDLAVEGQFELGILLDLPDPTALQMFAGLAEEIVCLIGPDQVVPLRSLIPRASPMRLPSEADRARERTLATRQMVRGLIEEGSHLDEELMAIAPLLDEHDPALVAAALARAVKAPPMSEAPDMAFARIFLSIGKTDGVRPGDIVGALLNGVGIPKKDLGKVEIAERHSIVEVSASVADQSIRGLNGSIIKKRRVNARFDRK